LDKVTVTTNVWWKYNGLTLNTLAYNIKTRGGSRMGTADPRGENQLIPGMTGRRFLWKLRDSRIITLQMWVRGSDEDGTRPVGNPALIEKFDNNWNLLANIFDADGQYYLEKRFRDGVGGYKQAKALAEYAGGLDPDMDSEYKADFAPQLLLADPWFYEDPIVGLTGAVTIGGNKPSDHVTATLPAGSQMTWQGGERFIKNNSGGTAVIDCRERSAMVGAGYVNGLITRDRNTADWCTVYPGSMTFTFSAGGSLAYQPAWR
jgi:hypothetical protein